MSYYVRSMMNRLVCKMPYTTDADMHTVVHLLQSEAIDISEYAFQEGQQPSLQTRSDARQLPETSESSLSQQLRSPRVFDAKLLTVQILREQMEASPIGSDEWVKQLSANSGVSEILVQKIINGKKRLTVRTAKKLIPYLFSDQSS